MHTRQIFHARCASALIGLALGGQTIAADAELVHSPPMAFSVDPVVSGRGGALEPRWLNAMGMVGGNQYRLVVLANTAHLDMIVTQSAGAQCSIRRHRAASAEGVPVAPAQAALTLPVGAQSLMMRLAQAPELQYVYLYNDSPTGSCTVWLQAS
ncbi:MAG: hypothetical protein IT480_08375 [Gammaproteobacteria bacterium]|nr:hypothetical protein [Gammaproteobacteria bacterium]